MGQRCRHPKRENTVELRVSLTQFCVFLEKIPGRLEVRRWFQRSDQHAKIAVPTSSEVLAAGFETGFKQPEAIALYLKNGYVRIPNYGQYVGVENSFCFEKEL